MPSVPTWMCLLDVVGPVLATGYESCLYIKTRLLWVTGSWDVAVWKLLYKSSSYFSLYLVLFTNSTQVLFNLQHPWDVIYLCMLMGFWWRCLSSDFVNLIHVMDVCAIAMTCTFALTGNKNINKLLFWNLFSVCCFSFCLFNVNNWKQWKGRTGSGS